MVFYLRSFRKLSNYIQKYSKEIFLRQEGSPLCMIKKAISSVAQTFKEWKGSIFYRGYELYRLPSCYSLSRAASPCRGGGFEIFEFNLEQYLMAHDTEGRPMLIGKIKGKPWLEHHKYTMYLKRISALAPEEREAADGYVKASISSHFVSA